MPIIRIFLVDDHQLVRDGIKALLIGAENIEIIGEASTGKEFFEKLSAKQPDILILDISLPDASGIDITRRISSEHPEIKVLILSMYTNEDFVINSVKAGARGYLPKNTSREELLEAIHTVYGGEEFFAASISKIILKSYLRNAREDEPFLQQRTTSLTSREIEILRLFAEGHINKEISDKLDISIRTVETHKNHIMKKLELKSTVELIKFAIKNKLIEL